jgi:hypothetical protein
VQEKIWTGTAPLKTCESYESAETRCRAARAATAPRSRAPASGSWRSCSSDARLPHAGGRKTPFLAGNSRCPPCFAPEGNFSDPARHTEAAASARPLLAEKPPTSKHLDLEKGAVLAGDDDDCIGLVAAVSIEVIGLSDTAALERDQPPPDRGRDCWFVAAGAVSLRLPLPTGLGSLGPVREWGKETGLRPNQLPSLLLATCRSDI